MVHVDGRVLRRLSETGRRDWDLLSRSAMFRAAVAGGRMVDTLDAGAELEELGGGWAGLVEHERVPFLSYPYEWTFGMLSAAAILHLELLLEALREGLTTKDGYAYNVQWRGVEPLFIDVSSFTTYSGGPWAGYRQFCETFLNPLLLQALVGVDFHPWIRGRLEGIPVQDMRRLLPGLQSLRPGVLRHVVLHALLDSKTRGAATSTQAALAEAGFGSRMVVATVEKLLTFVRRLRWRPPPSAWTFYASTSTYSAQDRATKLSFVEKVASSVRPRLAWDLGCNEGTYSRAVAAHAGQVVAMDADHGTVELLYRSLRARRLPNVLPLVVNLADPSPSLGWRNRERRGVLDRGRPDLVLCLALLHHLAIADNIPLPLIVEWLADLADVVVVEFVDRNDPMVVRLLANKPVAHADYSMTRFEHEVARHFRIGSREELSCGTRTLFALRRP